MCLLVDAAPEPLSPCSSGRLLQVLRTWAYSSMPHALLKEESARSWKSDSWGLITASCSLSLKAPLLAIDWKSSDLSLPHPLQQEMIPPGLPNHNSKLCLLLTHLPVPTSFLCLETLALFCLRTFIHIYSFWCLWVHSSLYHIKICPES